MPTEYPQFISNSAIGEDKFPEKAQETLARAISNLIVSKESKSKIIGLEGDWGSGKTNVIELIKKNIKNTHHIYIHDVWSFQEDLQRRTFLESLTSDLCKNSFLQNTSKWNDELKNLLAKRKEVTTDVTPVLSSGFLFVIFLIVFSALVTGFTFPWHEHNIPLRLLAFPLALIGYLYFSGQAERLLTFKDIFYIYREHETKRTTNETIFESEPSPERFSKWVADLQKDFTPDKELLVVFDNMDRLPEEKIRQMWSLIHAFFAEQHFEKIWVIVPYSREHIRNGFHSDSEQADHFIDKTFTVQFQISPPILSDWKSFFNDIFIQAHGKDEQELTVVRAIFDRLCIKITPRKIINFINETVSLKKIWKEKIPLRYIALYALTKRVILESPTQQILKKEFLGNAINIFQGDPELQNYIAALVYNIPLTSAAQIALQQDLIQLLRTGTSDIKSMTAFAQQPFFLDLMETIVANEPDTKGFSIALDSIITEVYQTLDKQRLDSIWQTLEVNKNKKIRDKQEFDLEDQIILNRIPNERKQNFIDRILVDFDTMGEAFSGKDYFNAMASIENYVRENNIAKVSVEHKLKSPVKKANVFIDYLGVAKDKYKKYGIKADNKTLNEYASNTFKGEGELLCLAYLRRDTDYDFSAFTKTLKDRIQENKVSLPILNETLFLLKNISKNAMTKLISTEHLNEYFEDVSFPDDEVYPDLVAISFGYIDELDESSEAFENFDSDDEDLIKAVATCSFKYITLGELFNITVTTPHNLVSGVVKQIISKNIQTQSLNIVDVLTNFDNLHRELELEAKDVLNYLNKWAAPLNLQSQLPIYRM